MKGSDHLEFILEHRLFRPISTKKIEGLYESISPDSPDFNFVTAAQLQEKSIPEERIILPADCHAEVSKVLDVPELSNEVERAVWQVHEAERKGKEKQQQSNEAGK